MNADLRILLLEDSASDAELVEAALARGGVQATTRRVETREAFTQALRDFQPHVVLSDHSLGQIDAQAALDLLQAIRPLAPLIIVTGTLDGQGAVASLRAGAENLVLKDNLNRLGPSILQALEVRRPLEHLSPRQLEVLRLVVHGATTREIAARLQLSVKTIETHRGEIMKRLGIHDLVGLVRYATRVGLVSQLD